MARKSSDTHKRTTKAKALAREAQLPEQKLGDTPVAPWQAPRPEQKEAARPVRQALAEVLADVDSEEKAAAILDDLERALGDVPAEAVAKATPKADVRSVGAAAQSVAAAAARAPRAEKPAAVVAETARVIEATKGTRREALAEATQEVFNPEQQAAPDWLERRREYLRAALLHRLKPLEALDASLFLRVNHLPHSRMSNGMFYFVTSIFSGGGAWYALMGATVVARQRWNWPMARASAFPLTVASLLVELPIKAIFRRRRPFITIVRAIVIGKKPGTWSFPSGHSASAFAGAWVMRQHFPRLTPLWYTMAGLVAFSRIYLGDHYPSDVVTGSLLGHFFARFFGQSLGHRRTR